jgi:hypothetical protein
MKRFPFSTALSSSLPVKFEVPKGTSELRRRMTKRKLKKIPHLGEKIKPLEVPLGTPLRGDSLHRSVTSEKKIKI